MNGILRNWESLCDIRPDCHHHFDASGTSNAMFDELAERSLMSPLAGTKHTYVRLAIIIYCQILTLFFKYLITITIIKNNNNNNNKFLFFLTVSIYIFIKSISAKSVKSPAFGHFWRQSELPVLHGSLKQFRQIREFRPIRNFFIAG